MDGDLISVATTPPDNFVPEVEVVGVLCGVGEEYLFLQRGSRIPHPLLWNIPGGKVDEGESLLTAAVREMEEEAGFRLDPAQLKTVGTIYIHRPGVKFPFHLYHAELSSRPELQLDPIECADACWTTLEEALTLPLISAGVETLQFASDRISQQTP